MTQTTQSIADTFHNAGIDEEMAEKIREAMAYSGYSHADFHNTMKDTRQAIAATCQPRGAFGS